ncbi:MAG: hypothetical protein JST27_02745 [Bacteroidetes bacterium]|nr:hypothetical protein [Bacteroidota bacterium]
MKTTIFFLLCVLLSTTSFARKIIVIDECSGSPHPDGSMTYQYCDGGRHDAVLDQHFLNCWNPGSNGCKWKVQPKVGGTDQITDYINQQVALGISEGSFNTEDGYHVTWSIDDSGCRHTRIEEM